MNWLTGSKFGEAQKWVKQLPDATKRDHATAKLLLIGVEAAPALIEALQSQTSSLPPLVGQILIRMGPAATPALTHSLLNDHPETRGKIADILSQTKDPKAIPALLEALNGEFYTVRARAAHALGNILNPHTLQSLVARLHDSESEVRSAVVLAIGHFRDPGVFDHMADLLLEDPDIAVRQAAAKALGDTHHPQVISYLLVALHDSFWWYEREQAVDILLTSLENIGKPAVDPLIAALKDPEGTVRRYAAILLGRIGDARAIEPLGMALYDMHAEVGQAAAESLAGFGRVAVETLMEARGHPEAWLRRHAVHGLGCIQDQRVLPLLIEMLDDPDRDVQRDTILALIQLGDPSAIPALQSIALNRSDREFSSLARGAIEALGKKKNG